MIDADKGGERIPLGSGVTFGLEKSRDQVRGVGNEGWGVLVNGGHGEDGVLADVRMAVLEARSGGGQERLDQFGLAKLAEEAQGVAADVLVGVLEVVSYAVAAGQTLSVRMETRDSQDWGGEGRKQQLIVVAYQTRIISCLSFPPASSLGQIS